MRHRAEICSNPAKKMCLRTRTIHMTHPLNLTFLKHLFLKECCLRCCLGRGHAMLWNMCIIILSLCFSGAVENPVAFPPVSSSPQFSFPSSSSSSSSTSDRWPAERPRPPSAGSNRNARIPPRTDLPLDNQPPFVWRRGALSECSATCGKGQRSHSFECVFLGMG